MISTDSYPNLDDAHRQALFQAVHDVVQQSLDDTGHLAQGPENTAGLAFVQSLPPKYLPRYDGEFARRFAATVATVTWKMTEPEHVFPLACRAEELALKYVIDTAERIYRAAQPNAVPDYDDVRDRLFEDDDYLQLWEDDGDALDLDFEQWFEPFRRIEQVHPYCQTDPEEFNDLWSDPEPPDDLVDPETEVYLALGEDWLDVPTQIADAIPAMVQETAAALFPEQASWRRLGERDRTRLFDNVAEDVRLLLDAARGDTEAEYDVWAVTVPGTAGKAPSRVRLQASVPLAEALDARRLARVDDYRGRTDVSLRVYPVDHPFDLPAS